MSKFGKMMVAAHFGKKSAKYYERIVDFTPDLPRVEQATFLLRYLVPHKSRFKVVERFLKFVDCSDKKDLKLLK